MPTPAIIRADEHFFVTTYEGNGAGQRVGKFLPYTDNGTIANSFIMNDGSSGHLSRTVSSTTNRDTWTFSTWIKRCGGLGALQVIFQHGADINNCTQFAFDSSNRIKYQHVDSGSNTDSLISTRTFENTGKWYHVVLRCDTTQATEANRVRIYIDGNQITDFDEENYPGQNVDTDMNLASVFRFGGQLGGTHYGLDCYLAEMNFADGQSYGPDTFGVTDTSTGRWIPKSLSGITYGTNGFRLQFLDSTHAGIDTSGNGNTFTNTSFLAAEPKTISMGGSAFDTGSAGAWDGSYPVAKGFQESTAVSDQAIYNDGSTAIGGVIGWDFGSGKSANIQGIKINQVAVNNSITGFTFEYSDNGSDYTSVGTFSVTASTSTQTVSVTNTAGKHRYWRLKSTTNTHGGQSSYRWIVAFLGFYSEPVTTDSPTQNFVTFSPTRTYLTAQTVADGNLQIIGNSASGYSKMGVNKEIPQSGKWHWEIKCTHSGGVQGISNQSYGVIDLNMIEVSGLANDWFIHKKGGMGLAIESGAKIEGLLSTATDTTIGSTTLANGDYVLFAFDMDNGYAWFGHYDLSAGTTTWFANDGGTDGNPATGANPTVTFKSADHRFLPLLEFYAPGSYPGTFNVNFGSTDFRFAPTGYSGLSQNLFQTTDKGTPDMVWFKNRDSTDSHQLYDSTRGPLKDMHTDSTAQESTTSDGLQKFLKGGVEVEDDVSINEASESIVSWNWVANGGTTSANTDGSGATLASTIQANQTAGFSIVQVTAPSSPSGTYKIAHGLGAVPHWILGKNLPNTGGYNWSVYHHKNTSDPATDYLELNTSDATADNATVWGDVAPTSTVFTVGTGVPLIANEKTIFYCWTEISGFSKFGVYVGNGSSNGPYVYTGFKPAWLMIKRADSANSWGIVDSGRDKFNPRQRVHWADLVNAEDNRTDRPIDFTASGFKIRAGSSETNANADGGTYVFMAFAEYPFIGDGTTPLTAQ